MSEAYFLDVDVLKGPVLSILRNEGYQAVDMHYHTNFSVDGLASVKAVLSKCKHENFGVAITDHNHIRGALKARQLAAKSVFLIPGMELTSHNGVHLLLHFHNYPLYQEFYMQMIKPRLAKNPWFLDLGHEEVIDLARSYDCLITAPHPFGPGVSGIKKFKAQPEVVKKIHAVETINGTCVGRMNTRAIDWARKIGKGFTGGSDGHCLAELGTSLTLCKADNAEEFLNQVKRQKSLVLGKQEQIFADAINAVSKFIEEERRAPTKQLEKMWKDRGLLEWNYFKRKLAGKLFKHHYHAHHQEANKEQLSKHEHTRHLIRHLPDRQSNKDV